jgi:hypothetical protein
MAACLIGHIAVKDPGQWKIYTDGVAKSLTPIGVFWRFAPEREDRNAQQIAIDT